MANLTGSPLPIEIAPGGYTLQAPALQGTITELAQSAAATRGESGAYEAPLRRAASDADVVVLKTFAIDVSKVDTTAAPATRGGVALTTAEREAAISLRVPAVQAGAGHAVLYTDEAGISRWIFPNNTGMPGAPATRGGVGEIEFLLPRDVAPTTPTGTPGPATRGQLTKLGRRLVRVLAWATEDVIGKGAMYVATQWEGKRRPYGLRRFPFDDARPIDWNTLRGGRALLLIHGTFSTAEAGFSLVPRATIDALRQIYGERMFAFDHPTLHVSPEENVQKFFEMLPDGADLEVDIVTHSRGGLVGREFAERNADYASANRRKLKIRRAVFVAAPLRGTVLADTEHGIKMLDRYTNLFTELPDNPFTISMEAIFMMTKLVYHGAVKALPGLRSMYPPGEYLLQLNKNPNHTTEYYALAADFKPQAETLLARFGWAVADAAVDGIFGEANDGVVPTTGSYELKTTVRGFPIEDKHRSVFVKADGVHHCNYFAAAATNQHLLHWLGA
jgi:pimeloyl-ACP methyl ester carboxylesterase